MTDPESLQQWHRPRSRCLDPCLVSSVTLLYLLFLGSALWTATFIKLEKDAESQYASAKGLPAVILPSKMKNVVYLKPKADQLVSSNLLPINKTVKRTMEWAIVTPKGSSSGTWYTFNNVQHFVQVENEGNYLIGVTVVLNCTTKCPSGSVDLIFKNKQNEEKVWCQMKLLNNEAQGCIKMVPLSAKTVLLADLGIMVENENSIDQLNNWTVDDKRSVWWIYMTDK